jgi:hypothetical protein
LKRFRASTSHPQPFSPEYRGEGSRSDVGATDTALKELKDFKQLTTLSLMHTSVTDAGLKELKSLKQLPSLHLTGTQVTDEGVADLQKALPDCTISR